MLMGVERAGDVLVSLETLRERPNVNSESLHLIGWSHGGWAVMDAATLAAANKRPPLLTELPADALSGVRNAVAFYPYCDFGSFTSELGWPSGIDGLVILAEKDQTIDPEPCYETIAQQAALSRPLYKQSYAVEHWLDNPLGKDIVPHEYNDTVSNQVRSLILSRVRGTEQRARLVVPSLIGPRSPNDLVWPYRIYGDWTRSGIGGYCSVGVA